MEINGADLNTLRKDRRPLCSYYATSDKNSHFQTESVI